MFFFWGGVDSKSEIHFFFRLLLENPDNPEKSFFLLLLLSRFSGVRRKKWTSELDSEGQKTFLNDSLIQEITANPKIHSR